MEQFGNAEEYFRGIFDANPIATLIMDHEARVVDLNRAALELVAAESGRAMGRLGGDAIRCTNGIETGCGNSPRCGACVINSSVKQAAEGVPVRRKPFQVDLKRGGEEKKLDVMVTATPLPGRRALLILEDLTEVLAFRQLIPICGYCKKVRDDREYWHSLEGYMHSHLGFKMSHGVCPTCMARELQAVGMDPDSGVGSHEMNGFSEANGI
jgi:hypothetical protein